MFKNKMKIPVLIWIPKFVYNNVAMICAIPFIPAEKLLPESKEIQTDRRSQSGYRHHCYFYRFISLVSTNQSTHFSSLLRYSSDLE